MRIPIGRALLLAAPLLLCACPRQVKPRTDPADTTIANKEAHDETSAIAGTYLCDFGQTILTPAQSCTISEDGDTLQFEMQHSSEDGSTHSLLGPVTATAYGFRWQGNFDSEAVEVDVMRQGAGSFAAVIQLADKSLYKLNLRPQADGANQLGPQKLPRK